MLTATRSAPFRHRSVDGDVAAVRRRFFDWLEGHSPAPAVRKELLDLVTSLADELSEPVGVGFTVTADDGGDNLLVRFFVRDAHDDDELPARLGRGAAAVDRVASRLIEVAATCGAGYVLLDISLPRD